MHTWTQVTKCEHGHRGLPPTPSGLTLPELLGALAIFTEFSVPIVDVRNVQTNREFFYGIISVKPTTIAGKQKSQQIEKIENGSFAGDFIHENEKRRHKEGYTKSTGGRLRWQEKAKRENV